MEGEASNRNLRDLTELWTQPGVRDRQIIPHKKNEFSYFNSLSSFTVNHTLIVIVMQYKKVCSVAEPVEPKLNETWSRSLNYLLHQYLLY